MYPIHQIEDGCILAFPDKESKFVKIVCTSKGCRCGETPLHPEAYRHPAIVIDHCQDSADVLKVTSQKPEARHAYFYLKVLGPQHKLEVSNPADLLLERGAMDHDSYVNLEHTYNVPISELKNFRENHPKLDSRSLQHLKDKLDRLERPYVHQETRRFSAPAVGQTDKQGDDSVLLCVPSTSVEIVRASIDRQKIWRDESGWKPKPNMWGVVPKKLKHWTTVKFRMIENNIKNAVERPH